MIKGVIERKINDNFDKIVDEIIACLGYGHENEIRKRMNDIDVLIIQETGVVKSGNHELYIEDEPVCIKDDEQKVLLIIPVYSLCKANGNVVFVHLLLHALGDEPFIKEGKDAFNETIVDYMANEIAKNLANKGINITMVDNPLYESNSFYSRMFSEIEGFYKENRNKIIDARMGKKVIFENADYYIDMAQSIVDEVFLSRASNDEAVIKRR